MKQIQLFFTTFTSIFFYLTLLLYLFKPDYFRNFLLSLLPMLFGVWIVGFLLTYVYYEKIQQKYDLSKTEMILSDFTGHLLPVIITLIILYKHRKNYYILWWIIFVYLGLFLLYLLVNQISYKKFWEIYPGIPKYIVALGFISTFVIYFIAIEN